MTPLLHKLSVFSAARDFPHPIVRELGRIPFGNNLFGDQVEESLPDFTPSDPKNVETLIFAMPTYPKHQGDAL